MLMQLFDAGRESDRQGKAVWVTKLAEQGFIEVTGAKRFVFDMEARLARRFMYIPISRLLNDDFVQSVCIRSAGRFRGVCRMWRRDWARNNRDTPRLGISEFRRTGGRAQVWRLADPGGVEPRGLAIAASEWPVHQPHVSLEQPVPGDSCRHGDAAGGHSLRSRHQHDFPCRDDRAERALLSEEKVVPRSYDHVSCRADSPGAD